MSEPLDLPEPFDVPTLSDPIINGDRERGYPSAVGLGTAGFTICTGSLIAPRVVLTAAHCNADLPIDLIVQLGAAYVGTDAAAPDESLAFSGAVIHPGYVPLVSGGALGENDVAVLFLAEDAPIAPVWFRTEPLRARATEGDDVVSVGFGLDENGTSNVKRSATLKIAELDPVFLVSDSSGNTNGANICSGDSGGPQYHVEDDGTLVQWAVHSWGDVGCRVESGSTRTDVVAEWILDQVEAEHGSRDRCEVFGYYADGICQTDCDRPDPDCFVFDPPSFDAESGCGCNGGVPVTGWLLAPLLLTRRRAGPRVRTPAPPEC